MYKAKGGGRNKQVSYAFTNGTTSTLYLHTHSHKLTHCLQLTPPSSHILEARNSSQDAHREMQAPLSVPQTLLPAHIQRNAGQLHHLQSSDAPSPFRVVRWAH
ncbi:hypothetical protein TRVL_01107 [Trypanosoma vivax]|nr:hypothetical protein TRVL_01107 [Trypanosoma vivax]